MRPARGWRQAVVTMMRGLAQTTALLLAVATALAAASGEEGGPFSDAPFPPEMPPTAGPFTTDDLFFVQAWHLLAAVLWLSAASFAAGILVAAAARKHASLWAPVAVAAFLGIVLAAGVRPAPGAALHPVIAGGGVLILTAAAAGGWIGQHVWRPTRRGLEARARDHDQSG